MDWARDGADWPNREASRFVKAGGLTWHVQIMGSGPPVLLVHGTGASSHSWRDFAPALARHFTVIAPDMPGHGFTGAPSHYRMTLPSMAAAAGALLDTLGLSPEIAIGHSAGAAIVLRMALDGLIAPRLIVSLNGALLPMQGPVGPLFSSIARTLLMIPVVPWFFSWRAGDRGAVERLLAGTGSTIDDQGIDLYAKLMRDSGHVGNVLAMMANWELEPFARDLPRLRSRLLLIAADRDRAIPPDVSRKVQKLVPGSELLIQRGFGHLSHEEAPEETAELVLREAGVPA